MASMLLINGVPIECINRAAVQYYVPATLIVSVLETENGHVGDAKPNSNGTFDYGPMQVNSIWINRIAKYGYNREDLQYNPCINVAVGTWILSQALSEDDNFWKAVGDYHSHSEIKNLTYSQKVQEYYKYLNHLFNDSDGHSSGYAQ